MSETATFAPAAEHASPVPLTPAQGRRLVMEWAEAGGPVLDEPLAVLLVHGGLDPDALAGAVRRLVAAHPALRTTVEETAAGWVQRIHDRLDPELVEYDAAGRDVDAVLDDLLAAHRTTRLDPYHGPVLRVVRARLAADRELLVVAAHPLVCDEQSAEPLLRDLAAWYADPTAEAAGPDPRPDPPAPAPPPAEETGPAEPVPVDLPVDRPRRLDRTYAAGRLSLRLEPALTRAVHGYAAGHGVDPVSVLLAAFAAVLARHTGQREMTIGVAERRHAADRDVVGRLADLLLPRVRVEPELTFTGLVAQVCQALADARRDSRLPADRFLSRLAPPTDATRPPLASVVLATVSERPDPPRLGGHRTERVDVDTGLSRYECQVRVRLADDAVDLEARYARELFDRETVRRLMGHLRTLLAGALDGPDTVPVARLPLLTEAEARLMLVDWNDTAADLDHGRGLHEHFAARAAATPDAPAVIHGGRPVSFRTVDTAANRLAHHLRRVGVGRRVRVGLSLERGPDLLVAILAVLKAGGAYVPLDADYPAPRLEFMLRDADCAVLVTDSRTAARLPRPACPVVLVDRDAAAIAACPEHPPPGEAGPDDLCYVIYTSGSTGTPKGIALRHRGVVNNLLDLNTRFAVGGADRVLALSSTSFDMSVYELLGVTIAGGAVVVPEPARLRDPAHWYELITAHRVTVWNSAPALLELFVSHLEEVSRSAGAGGPVRTGLRLALLGGDWVAPTLPDRARAFAPGLRTIVMGGATESSIHSTIVEAGSPLPGWTTIPYGRPMANQRVYLLDEARQPVPIGVPGELHLAGIGLAEGYLGRPDLTAERFFEWSYGPVRGERLYRTGDLARYRPDGLLELLGRLDFQVKIRGLRVELGEVEAALRAVPGVAEAVVVAARDDVGDNRLVGYLVPAEGAAPDVTEVRDRVAAVLPGHLVPADLVLLDALPVSPNGKVDRARLADMAPPPAARGGSGGRPVGPVEELIAQVWRDVLGVAEVGRGDRFTELGGHSLAAMRVVSRLRRTLDTPPSLTDLLSGQSLAAIARRLSVSVAPPGAGGMTRRAGDGPVPLSPAQERIWYLSRLLPGSPVYHVGYTLPWPDGLDHRILARCLDRLVARHAALRTRFGETDGVPWQQVGEAFPVRLEVEEVDEAAVAARVREEVCAGFDLGAGRLLRARLFRHGRGPHTLVLTTHHIVVDAWSLDVFFTELGRLYQAELDGRPVELPEPPVRYVDYAVWQREWLDGALASELAYWRQRLAGAPLVLELPGDRTRPAEQTFRGGHHRVRWGEPLRRRLDEVGREHGVTLFMILLAGFATLLHRYTGATDLIVGVPMANRTRPELEPLVGFFVNTVPLRIDLSGNPGFPEVLARVRSAALAGYDHQELPFERLVDALRPERDPARMPIVQVLCQTATIAPLRVAGHTLRPALVDTGTAKFDLTLTVEEDDAGLVGLFEYNGDIFDASTVDMLASRLTVLLGAVSDHPSARVSELPLLRPDERRRVLWEWNRTAAELPPRAVHELVAEQADRRGDATAVWYGGQRLTYRELDARATRLARRLTALGVRRGTRVGICVPRSPDLVVGLLAIWKAGGAYVPLDPQYPRPRLAYLLADAGIEVLLCRRDTRAQLPADGLRPVLIDGDGDGGAGPAGGAPDGPGGVDGADGADSPGGAAGGAGPDDLAYVIYTSGSTGEPKGVMVTHRAIVRLVRQTDYVRLGPGDRVAQAANASFDAITFELWGALANGAGVVILPRETVLDPDALAAAIREHGITTMFLTTAAVNAVARQRPDAFAPLRELLFGGEAVEPRWVRTILAAGPPRRLLHVYGPTETTTFATWHEVTEVPADAVTVPIGRPIANTGGYVLDARMRPVPPGFTGELYLSGPGLAVGYLGRPALTAERFVPHPFGERPGERLYRTGDLVRQRPDGAVEFLGRVDNQVKIRGFRVEPGEVETTLGGHPSVVDAAVTAVAGEDGARLVAFVVPDPEARLAVGDIREYLRQRLPEHLVPSGYVLLDALPLTANGKVDRGALRVPDDLGLADDDRAYVPPRTPVEEVLAEIWADLLGVARVGIDDDFFERGGHSLLAVRLVARVAEALGAELPLRVLLAGPTPRAVAAALERSAQRPARAAVPPPTAGSRPEPVPLSYAQQRLWFMEQIDPEGGLYTVPLVLRLHGALDPARLGRALDDLVARHEVLRTRYPAPRGRPRQEVLPAGPVPLPLVDLTGRADPAGEAARLAAEQAGRPFDLAAAAPLRARLLRVGPDEHRLLLTLHHIAVDALSLDLLFGELGALYRGESLSEVVLQYPDYAVWQRDVLRGPVLDDLVDYWRATLGDDPPVAELPTDRPRPARRRFRGTVVHGAIGPELAGRLRRYSRQQGATLYMTLLAAFQALLAGWSGVAEVTVGTPVAGRTRPELRDLVGCLINMVPLRTDLSGDPDLRELLARVRRVTLGAFAHQDLPFDLLVNALVSRRGRDFMPLFRVMFSLLGQTRAPVLAGLDRCELELGWRADTALFDLSLVVEERDDGGLRTTVQYDSDLFLPSTAAALLVAYERTLAHLVDAADEPVRRAVSAGLAAAGMSGGGECTRVD